MASDDVIWFPEDLHQTKGLTVASVLEELSLPELDDDDEEDERWWWIHPEDDRAAWEVEVDEAEEIEWRSIPRVKCSACRWEAPAFLVKNELCRYCRCRTCGESLLAKILRTRRITFAFVVILHRRCRNCGESLIAKILRTRRMTGKSVCHPAPKVQELR